MGDTPGRASVTAVTSLSSGSSLGPFLIIELLGKGGMAAVYHAYDTELERDVALKVLPPESLHDDSFARRFEREARLVAQLEHPHIVPIYANGIHEGIPWMSMRLLAGGSLDAVLKKHRLPVARVLEILRSIAEALDHAHAAGVVHRDIKPSNVLLDDAGRVFVGDFGLARVIEQSLLNTQTAVAGTPHYMAPEQALGGEVDHRCDIYGLGVVAYEMFTGRVPFAADSPLPILLKHVNEPPPAPSSDEMSATVWVAVERCLAKQPDDRWPSAAAFATALEEAVAKPSLSPSLPLPSSGPDKQRPVARWAVLAGLLLATIIGMSYYPGREMPAEPIPAPSTGIERPAVSAADEPSPGTVAPPPSQREPSPVSLEDTSPAVPSADVDPPVVLSALPPVDAEALEPPAAAEAPPADPVVAPGFEPAPVSVIVDRPASGIVERVEAPPADRPAPPPPAPTPVYGDRSPVLLNEVKPTYPQLAQAAAIEGAVVLRATVDAKGQVTDVKVVRSNHRLFDEPATEAVRRYEYQPGLRAGVPAPFEVEITLQFVLAP
jgi:serine/threonine-protein kinase